MKKVSIVHSSNSEYLINQILYRLKEEILKGEGTFLITLEQVEEV